MIRINYIGIFWLVLFAVAIWFGWPVWIAFAWLAVEYPAGRWFIAGLIAGCFLPLSIGFNMGLRLRRNQMIERADQEYERDRRKWRQ